MPFSRKKVRVIDFSPMPMNKTTGNSSGERFRTQYLVPAIRCQEPIEIDFDGVQGISSAWLKEAFGGLRRWCSTQDILRFIFFSENKQNPSIVTEALSYIEEQEPPMDMDENRQSLSDEDQATFKALQSLILSKPPQHESGYRFKWCQNGVNVSYSTGDAVIGLDESITVSVDGIEIENFLPPNTKSQFQELCRSLVEKQKHRLKMELVERLKF